MSVELIGYPSCSTCKKALKYLKDHKIEVVFRHIVEDTPSLDEIIFIWKNSNLPLKKLFNTSGNVYKEMELSKKLTSYSEKEQLQLLADNGMLIKRPILIAENHILIGFDENKYQNMCDILKNVV